MANCNDNGKTYVNFLTTVAGGTLDNGNFLLDLTHYTCGNRKLCVSEIFPITSNLTFTVIGTPRFVGNTTAGNNTYCCDVLCSGTVTYMPYYCNRNCCNVCPVTDNIYFSFPVPCSSTTVPTVTAGDVVASPANVRACCNVTNAISLSTSLNVSTVKLTNDTTSGSGD